MWAEETVFYQIYPLGFCGAPHTNDGTPGGDGNAHRILKVIDFIPHLKKLGIGAVYFGPVFESDAHGYDTRDYRKIDVRLGTNEDFKAVCDALHANGIRVVLDGVFNHVGRGFFGFRDLKERKWDSSYKDWFCNVSFDGNSVSYCLPQEFLRKLQGFVRSLKPDFWTVGEILGGDYKRVCGDGLLDSATNYECYKGLYSSFNSMNLFEINHSLLRQFGSDPWCLYRGYHLFTFADNHDVTRAASILTNPRHLPLLYALAFGMPGIPCVYYGSEWGMTGRKEEGDWALRPQVDKPEWNELTDFIGKLTTAKTNSEALNFGDFRSVLLTNRQCIFERKSEHERVLVAINADGEDFMAHFDAGCGLATDLITGAQHDFGGGSLLPAYSAQYWKMEK